MILYKKKAVPLRCEC